MKKRLKEILGILDGDIYWKGCNYLQDIDDNSDSLPEFYSRDACRNISFKELLVWYLERLGQWQDEPNCRECEQNDKCMECEDGIKDRKVKELHRELFMELVDIYTFYNSNDCKKYNELKEKLTQLIQE